MLRGKFSKKVLKLRQTKGTRREKKEKEGRVGEGRGKMKEERRK